MPGWFRYVILPLWREVVPGWSRPDILNAMQDEVVVDDGFEQHVSTRATTPNEPGSGPDGGSGNDKQIDEKAADEREQEELVSSLKELTRYVSRAGSGRGVQSWHDGAHAPVSFRPNAWLHHYGYRYWLLYFTGSQWVL